MRPKNPPVSVDRVRQFLDYDPTTGIFTWRIAVGRSWAPNKPAGHVERGGYRRIMVDGQRCLAHRLAWLYVHGEWPAGDLDHRNGCRDDNRIDNIRPATKKQNSANTKGRNPTGMKGAVWNRFRGYWQAYIAIGGKQKWLGRFDTPEAAHAAYMAAAREVHGEFARGQQ